MSTNNQYYLHGILLPSGEWISQLTDTTPSHNVQKIVEYAAGSLVPSFRGAHGARPDVTFTSTQLGTILAATGLWGAAYAATNVDLFYRLGSNLGTRAALASSAHLRIRAVRSVLYWDRISAKQGDLATISCRLVPTFDGTNPPLVATGSLAIATQPLAVAPYTLGPVKLNGVSLDAIAGWDLALNPEINEKASGGDSWTSFCGINRHNPVLTVTPEDLGNWATIGHTGLQLTSLVAYLRKKSADLVTNVANGTAEHIAFSATDNPCGIATIENSSGGIGSPATASIQCGLRVTNAATTHPLTLSVVSTIV
jgi:hypothetical protein